MLLIYRFLPNKQIKLPFAAVGSFCAALLWSGATNLFAAYIGWSFNKESSTFSVLYGSLGLLPLFLFWIYFLWIIVLYGFELTCILQTVQRGMHGQQSLEREPPPIVDPACVVVIMRAVIDRFEKGQSAGEADIIEETGLNAAVVDMMLTALRDGGFVHKIDDAGVEAYTPARPGEQIRTDDLIDLAQQLVPIDRGDNEQTEEWLAAFRKAQRGLDVHRSISRI